MSEELKEVNGFYIGIGSRDYPAAYPEESPFGFDPDNDIAIFKHSQSEVIEAFVKPISLMRSGVLNNAIISKLITEGDKNPALNSVDIYHLDWQNVYKIIEWCYNNQATIINTTTWPETNTYTNFPDYVFRNRELDAQYSPDLVNYVSTYMARTFYFSPSSKKDRISDIEFKIRINSVPKTFKIYFDADNFITQYNANQFFVYYYKDIDGNDKISQKEFDKQIIDALNTGIMGTKWKTVRQYFTAYHEPIYDMESNQITGHKDGVNRSFYVYTNMPDSELTTEIVAEQIRQQLIKDNNNSENDLSNQYPNLFIDQQVYIYPIHDNIVSDPDEIGKKLVANPISYNKIQEVMRNFGYPTITTADNYRNSEIFYVGFDNPEKNTIAKYNYPLIAFDYSADKTKQPITSRFPYYSPRTLSNITESSEIHTQFQFILINILGYLDKTYSKEELIANLSVLNQNLETTCFEATDEEFAKVTFKLKNTKFIVTWYNFNEA